MADARHASLRWGADARLPPLQVPPVAVVNSNPIPAVADVAGDNGGWVEVRRRWRRQVRPPGPPPCPVPADLVGRCFNCLARDHVAAACRNPSRCLRCGNEGHQARNCKRGRAFRGGSLRPSRPSTSTRLPQTSRSPISHGAGNSRPGRSPASDSTRSARSQSTSCSPSLPEVCAPSPFHGEGPPPPSGSLSPSPKPVGDPSRRPRSEICVIPRTHEIDATEARLYACALVAVIGGTRPSVSCW